MLSPQAFWQNRNGQKSDLARQKTARCSCMITAWVREKASTALCPAKRIMSTAQKPGLSAAEVWPRGRYKRLDLEPRYRMHASHQSWGQDFSTHSFLLSSSITFYRTTLTVRCLCHGNVERLTGPTWAVNGQNLHTDKKLILAIPVTL